MDIHKYLYFEYFLNKIISKMIFNVKFKSNYSIKYYIHNFGFSKKTNLNGLNQNISFKRLIFYEVISIL